LRLAVGHGVLLSLAAGKMIILLRLEARMAIGLEGGCRVSLLREGTCKEHGTVRDWPHAGRASGAEAISLRVLELAPAPRTTVQSPLTWSADPDWKLDYCNVERLTPEEIARRRAEFDRGKVEARSVREAGERIASVADAEVEDF